MNVAGNVAFIDEMIANQRASLRLQVGLAIGVVALGIGVIVLAHVVPEAKLADVKGLLTLGGAFVSTLTAFPLKDVATRRDKVAALHLMRREFEALGAGPSGDAQQAERLQQRFSQFVDKILGG